MSHYEDALRYVFDRCGRGGGPEHLAEADTFRGAARREEWQKVDRGLALAIRRVASDAEAIPWEGSETQNGGVQPNFIHQLESAAAALESSSDPQAVRAAIAGLVHATKALVLKATDIPPEYRGGR